MTPLTEKRKLLIIALLLALITAATYQPVLNHDFINYDDPDYVSFNEVVQRGLTGDGFKWAFTTGHASNWHPVTWLSHMLDAQLFGIKPSGHHGMNVALHLANTVLLLLLLWRLTGAIWRSLAVAALFALHPLHVESVAWVAERKDVLSTFFGLLSLLAYAHYAKHSTLHLPSSILERFKTPAYWLAFIFLALGLMSKPMLVTWPFVMLLLDFWPLQRVTGDRWQVRGIVWKQLALEKLPFMALVAGSCVVTFLVQQGGGAVTTMENLPLEARLANAVVSYSKYLFMTLWPSGLAVFYPHPELQYPKSTQWPWWAILLTTIALISASVAAIRRWRETPFLATGWFWYLGTLVPVVGVVQVGTQALADRYTYVPLIGVFVVVAWGTHAVMQRSNLPPAIGAGIALMMVTACAMLSSQQVQVWRDDFSLFDHALAVTTGNAPAHSTLGKAWAKKGDFKQALVHLQAAKEADPNYPNIAYDTGLTLFYLGRYNEAIEEYLAELARKPSHLMARNNLASAYRSVGKTAEAIQQYRLVLQSDPNYLQSLYGLGSTLVAVGQVQDAVPYLTRSLEINPGLDGARIDLARAYAALGRFAEAEQTLNGIPDLDSNPNLKVVLGNIFMQSGRTNEALAVFRETARRFPQLAAESLRRGNRQLQLGNPLTALGDFMTAYRLLPGQSEAYVGAGLALVQMGKLEAAVGAFQQAITFKPSTAAYYPLALAYSATSRPREAITAYRKALELEPNSIAVLNNLAWMLATQPDDSLRNGQEAVELAERACKATDNKQPMLLGTLAAAYAETGRFADAIRTGEQAQSLAENAGLTDLARRNTTLVEQYQAGKPHRE